MEKGVHNTVFSIVAVNLNVYTCTPINLKNCFSVE